MTVARESLMNAERIANGKQALPPKQLNRAEPKTPPVRTARLVSSQDREILGYQTGIKSTSAVSELLLGALDSIEGAVPWMDMPGAAHQVDLAAAEAKELVVGHTAPV